MTAMPIAEAVKAPWTSNDGSFEQVHAERFVTNSRKFLTLVTIAAASGTLGVSVDAAAGRRLRR